jgi:phosphatidylinositol glycan class W
LMLIRLFDSKAAVLLWSALQARRSFFTPYGTAPLLVDFLLNVGAILSAITLYSSAPLLLNILLICPALVVCLGSKRSRTQQKLKTPGVSSKKSNGAAGGSKATQDSLDAIPLRPFLTMYRGAMLVITCLAILAVDFRVFPRRFAKVENWGTSLMDLGVGSFVFSAGLVSARSVLRDLVSSASKQPLPRRLYLSIRHSIPLLALGLIRFYSVKGLDYAEHVTEYGVHWNFFFTLALLPPFVEIFHSLTALIPSYEALSLLVAVGYQVILESTDLKGYILVSPRGPSWLSKNREGVFSFIGYLAIFLAGRATGLRVIHRDPLASHKTPGQARKRLLIQLAIWSSIWIALFTFNSTYVLGLGAGIPVSRRLANMPYVLWVVAFNNAQLLLFCLLETVFFPFVHRAPDKSSEEERGTFATSRIMRAFNKNGLAVFLLANLLTGAVNLGMNTLDAGTAMAMAVLIVYAGVLSGIALVLDHWNVKLKL